MVVPGVAGRRRCRIARWIEQSKMRKRVSERMSLLAVFRIPLQEEKESKGWVKREMKKKTPDYR